MQEPTGGLPCWLNPGGDESGCTSDSGMLTTSTIPTLKDGHLIQIQIGLTGRSTIEWFEEFVSKCSARALTPALSESLRGSATRRPDRVEIIFSIDSDRRIDRVVDFRESYRTPFVDAVSEKVTFKDWWAAFRPVTREDHRLALPLYGMCRNHGVYWAVGCSIHTDPWLDSLLFETRGMLLWTHHWEEVLRYAAGLKPTQVAEVMHEVRLGRARAREFLQSLVYEPTGQNLHGILRQRSPFEIPIGRVDHVVGDWFWNRLGPGSFPPDANTRTAFRGDQG